MFSSIARIALGMLLIGTLAVAQQRRHNEARIETIDGKRVIKLYSDGVLDTVIVIEKTRTSVGTNQKQSRRSNNASLEHSNEDWYKRRYEESIQQVERYAQQAERYAKQVEQYAQHAQELFRRHDLLSREPMLPSPPEFDQHLLPPSTFSVPPPRIPSDAQLRRRLEESIQRLKQAQHEYNRLIPRLRDTTTLKTLTPNDIEQLDADMRRMFDAALKTLEKYRTLSHSIRRWVEELQPQLERLKKLLEQYREDLR